MVGGFNLMRVILSASDQKQRTPMPEQAPQPKQPKKTGKGKPTPARKEQEQLRKKPVVGNRSPEAKRLAKRALQAERAKAREGLANGEDRYLTTRDRGPQRRLARDIVDSRFTAGELVLPALFLVIIISSIETGDGVIDFYIQLGTLVAMWGLFVAVGLDGFILGKKTQKMMEAKYGDKVEKGLRWYAAMRSIQMRGMRLPKPQVKRGNKIL
jgi:hypothetical protein